MIILNTTFITDPSIEKEFISWANTTYLPAIENAKIFDTPTMARIISPAEPEATSFAIQARTESLDAAKRWHDETAAILHTDLSTHWGERILFFTTYMETVDRK